MPGLETVLQSNGFNGTYSNKIVYKNGTSFMALYPQLVPLKHLKYVRLALQTFYNVDNFQEVFEKIISNKVRLSSFDMIGNFNLIFSSYYFL